MYNILVALLIVGSSSCSASFISCDSNNFEIERSHAVSVPDQMECDAHASHAYKNVIVKIKFDDNDLTNDYLERNYCVELFYDHILTRFIDYNHIVIFKNSNFEHELMMPYLQSELTLGYQVLTNRILRWGYVPDSRVHVGRDIHYNHDKHHYNSATIISPYDVIQSTAPKPKIVFYRRAQNYKVATVKLFGENNSHLSLIVLNFHSKDTDQLECKINCLYQ